MEWVGVPKVVGSNLRTQFFLTTVSIFGLQFVWSIEQSYVTLQLIHLNLSKSMTSLVWLASPLCGLIVQPIVGVFSDFSFNKHGRRRPYMVYGSIFTAIGLICFAYADFVCEFFNVSALFVAILSILLVDVSVNVCQATCRALIVDLFSEGRQPEVNAFAGSMAAMGHLASYFLSCLDLKKLGFSTQLRAASVIYSTVLLITIALTSVSVKERVLVRSPLNGNKLYNHLKQFFKTLFNLDFKLRAIFKVQLLAWYAWFTFLFYGAVYASDVWKQGNGEPNVDDMARAGSLSLTVFSLSATFFTFVLPRLKKLNIISIWMCSFLVYAGVMLLICFAFSFKLVLVLYAVVGFSWACTIWIPFALTAQRIHQLPLANLPTIETGEVEDVLTVVSDVSSDNVSMTGHEEKSGIIMGIHNSALTLPQFISAFCSFVIFQLAGDGNNALKLTLQVGGLTAGMAALYVYKLKQMW